MATRKPSVKKTTKKAAPQAAWRPKWGLLLLVTVLGAFALIFIAAAVLYAVKDNLKSTGTVINTRVAEISPDQIAANGEVELRDEAYITELRTFLRTEANAALTHDSCKTAEYTVTHATPDGKQLKLMYGCEQADAAAFAVQQGGTWKFLSPTNQFDAFAMPSCEHVGMHTISTEIAPVCWNRTDDGPSYMVR